MAPFIFQEGKTMRLLVGLGNPGTRYDNTYHNSGFIALDAVADELNVSFGKRMCRAVVAECVYRGEKIILAKPQTFMNLSGESVRELMAYFKIPEQDLMVFYDDYDLPLGSLRVRAKGSSGTHNGMRNIVAEIGTENFARVRLGIKPKEEVMSLMDYVLSERNRAARDKMQPAVDNAAKAALAFIGGESIDKIGGECNINVASDDEEDRP